MTNSPLPSEFEQHVDRVVLLIQRGAIGSAAMLADALLHHTNGQRVAIEKLIGAIKPDHIFEVHEVLSGYPWTEFGWSLLPPNRAAFYRMISLRKNQAI